MEIIWQLKLVLWSRDLEWHSQSIQRPHLLLSAVGYVTAACAAPLGGESPWGDGKRFQLISDNCARADGGIYQKGNG